MKESVILPQELIIEILLRLPVKSLLRFKCVSRSWLSLISDPQFLQSQRLLLLAQRDSKVDVRSVDVNASLQDDSVPSVMKLKFPLPNHVTIIDSCRGFVAFESYPDFYIWNPCTGFHKQLPPSPYYGRSLGVRASGSLYVRVCKILFGFGYDPLTNDYLIIVACCHGKRMDHVDIRAQIFSLRANSWKEMETDGWNRAAASITAQAPFGFKAGLNFSGAIHWLATRPSPGFIAAFDLTEKVFSEIALPNDFHSRRDDYVQLRVLGGFLCLCVDRADQNIGGEIWVMREYKVQSSWTKSHVVVPPHDNCFRHFSPMCFTKSGDIVGIDSRAKLVKFNDKGDVLEHRNCFCDHPLKCCYSDRRKECSAVFLKERSAVMLTESLLSLPCDRMNTGG